MTICLVWFLFFFFYIFFNLKMLTIILLLFLSLTQAEISTSVMNAGVAADHRGLLVINNQETMCQVVLLDDANGVVAASCLALKGKDELIPGNVHQVAIHKPNGDFGGLYLITKVKAHDDYNSQTMENNLATIEYQIDQGFTSTSFAVNSQNWKGMVKMYEQFDPKSPYHWDGGTTGELSMDLKTVQHCKDYSGLYSQNSGDIICSSDSAKWKGDSKCLVPFNSIYGGVDDTVLIGALYSYSMVPGNDPKLCSDKEGEMYHFYTKLDKYLPWIHDNTGWSGKGLVESGGDTGFKYKYDPKTRGRKEGKPVNMATGMLMKLELDKKEDSTSTTSDNNDNNDDNDDDKSSCKNKRDVLPPVTITVFAEPTGPYETTTETVVSYVTLPNNAGRLV